LLYHEKLLSYTQIACYPERNFGGNQLPGGSMSLSPL
jgi:hypothetical protein